jgi:hypothetical protein
MADLTAGVTSAPPHESKLVEDTLRQRHVRALPERMGIVGRTPIRWTSGCDANMEWR